MKIFLYIIGFLGALCGMIWVIAVATVSAIGDGTVSILTNGGVEDAFSGSRGIAGTASRNTDLIVSALVIASAVFLGLIFYSLFKRKP